MRRCKMRCLNRALEIHAARMDLIIDGIEASGGKFPGFGFSFGFEALLDRNLPVFNFSSLFRLS